MKFSLSLMNFGYSGDVHLLAELALEAEEAGWDAVLIADHVNWRDKGFHVDPWITLGLIADRTSHILIGTAITPIARRRPTKLAREILTLHQMSGERFILGAGNGAWPSEFEDLGDSGDLKIRAEMLDEGLELLQQTWSGENFDHQGAHYRAKGQSFSNGSIDIPIWLGATWPSRKPFRRAARFDGVMAMSQDIRNPLSLQDVGEISTLIAAQREGDKAFNFGVALTTSDDQMADIDRANEYEAAGANWWMEGVWPPAETLEGLRKIVSKGPPRR